METQKVAWFRRFVIIAYGPDYSLIQELAMKLFSHPVPAGLGPVPHGTGRACNTFSKSGQLYLATAANFWYRAGYRLSRAPHYAAPHASASTKYDVALPRARFTLGRYYSFLRVLKFVLSVITTHRQWRPSYVLTCRFRQHTAHDTSASFDGLSLLRHIFHIYWDWELPWLLMIDEHAHGW